MKRLMQFDMKMRFASSQIQCPMMMISEHTQPLCC